MVRKIKKLRHKKQLKHSSVHRALIHHSYSGRVVHHSHTNYPVLAFLMLLCGVLLIAATAIVRADTIQVTATVLGDPPATAATITSPVEDQRFSSLPITVEGSCPTDSIVKIYRNDVFSGSGVCSIDNKFTIQSDLFEGENELKARVFNYANVEGPVSDLVTVFYDKPASLPPTSTSTPDSSSAPTTGQTAQMFLDSDPLYRGFFVGQEVSWPIEIGGGNPPYAVNVDWGDGSSNLISVSKAGPFNALHTYTKAGGYNGSYNIVIKATDADGRHAYLQVVIIINDLKAPITTTTAMGGGISGAGLDFWNNMYHQILLMWPVYLVSLLMLTSFWLGGRREYNLLKPRLKLRKKHS